MLTIKLTSLQMLAVYTSAKSSRACATHEYTWLKCNMLYANTHHNNKCHSITTVWVDWQLRIFPFVAPIRIQYWAFNSPWNQLYVSRLKSRHSNPLTLISHIHMYCLMTGAVSYTAHPDFKYEKLKISLGSEHYSIFIVLFKLSIQTQPRAVPDCILCTHPKHIIWKTCFWVFQMSLKSWRKFS